MPTISGYVRDAQGNGITRVIRAYRRDTGVLIAETASNGITGAYSITTDHHGEHDVVMIDDVAGSVENDQILRTTPV